LEATWQTDPVADRHIDPTVTVRPAAGDKAAATEALRARGWTIQAYLLACIAELLAEPDRRVAEVESYRPPSKPIGRPRRSVSDQEDDGLGA
jgi:hypothetical protein